MLGQTGKISLFLMNYYTRGTFFRSSHLGRARDAIAASKYLCEIISGLTCFVLATSWRHHLKNYYVIEEETSLMKVKPLSVKAWAGISWLLWHPPIALSLSYASMQCSDFAQRRKYARHHVQFFPVRNILLQTKIGESLLKFVFLVNLMGDSKNILHDSFQWGKDWMLGTF